MLTFLYGNDGYRLELAAKQVVASYRARQGASLNVVRIDCTDDSAGEALERHLKYPSFFGDITLIIAHHAACATLKTVVDDYAVAELADVVVVGIQDTSAKGYDKKIAAAFQKKGDAAEYNQLTGAHLISWAQSFCGDIGGSIDTPTAGALVRRMGEDSRALAAELEKLTAYAGAEPITVPMISMLTRARVERDEWELSNAVASHDKRAIIASLWRSMQEGAPEQLLIGSIAAGFRNLIVVRNLADRQCAPAAIATTTGLHPFVVSKTLRGARGADIGRLIRCHLALASLDRNTKEGTADAADGLFDIVLSL